MENNSFPSGFRLQHLPELTEDIYFAFDPAVGKLIYLNEAFEKIFKKSRDAVNDDPLMILNAVHPDDREVVTESFSNLKTGLNQNLEFRIVVEENQERWMKLKAYLSHKDGGIILGTATDITDFKDYNNVLHKFTDKKNSILQIISHDLLGPLGNIKLSVAMLNRHSEIANNPEIMSLIELVSKNCQKGVAIIQDLVNNEFLQSSAAALVKERADMVYKISEAIDQFNQSPRHEAQKFKFEKNVESLFINIDWSKFMQVLTNLLSNALKFTPDDGQILVVLEDQENAVVMKVQDNGIGIPLDLQPFLFDKFTRARRKGIKGEPTVGLGMSIVKTIVEWHNGQIWFESEEGKGTTFYVKMPKSN